MTTLRRTALVLLPAVVALAACGEQAQTGDDEGPAMDTTTITVADVGLETPESVLHDAEADVYLVSNINGNPTAEDDNGFIARLSPDGEVATLKWIDGAADGVTLNAPKGMAIVGDTLYVTDITAVRAFHRETGEPLGSWTMEGSTFLNDLAVGADGALYVSDSGLNPDFSSSGTDAVYRFEDGEFTAMAGGTELNRPNGLATHDGELVVVSFGAAEARAMPAMGGEATIMELPAGQLDGVVVLDDGSMLVSSWEAGAVYHVPVDGPAMAVVEGVPSPADIGWDAERSRVLIPVFNENRVEIHYVETGGAGSMPVY